MLFAFLQSAHAHDASTYGGMFRSRDQGESWFSIDTGVFIGGALGLAVSPADRNHLLLATDAGLLRSLNGGRDWQRETQADLDAAVLAATFIGASEVAATPTRLLRRSGQTAWEAIEAPGGALPARALRSSTQSGCAYLLGADKLFVTNDFGRHWSVLGGKLTPEGVVTAFDLALREGREFVFAVIDGALWSTRSDAPRLEQRGSGLPAGKLVAVAASTSQRLHALAQGQLYLSEDFGANWAPRGAPLPETHLDVRGLAASADGKIILVTTHKGLYRSADGGASWMLKEGNLPLHLEAGPLVRDPHDGATFYAGYALTPYGETWQRALQARAQQPAAPSARWPMVFALMALFALALAALAWRRHALKQRSAM